MNERNEMNEQEYQVDAVYLVPPALIVSQQEMEKDMTLLQARLEARRIMEYERICISLFLFLHLLFLFYIRNLYAAISFWSLGMVLLIHHTYLAITYGFCCCFLNRFRKRHEYHEIQVSTRA